MGSYVISEIYSDGYERFAMIEDVEKNIKVNVHFLEYDEYLESGEKSQKKKKGDTLDGDISIQLVTFSRKADKALIHRQKIQKSPHIEAIIEVEQIIDEYSIYALSTISDRDILIEFENAVSYKVGERVLVIGSLELSETSKGR
ncbi:hypothetical protein [Pseudoflavonifractor phocaeensis]|uniref:hypothetical protein n=1 Tax=Pseudoflavonifractor phocaeensis TaxID=1870988 RepID=UPI001957CBFD|nr:hypothetical protein [Pseudoflavonifractor phocaeensis]MBM6725388.1 hypothetical protein [Pseudoflavonifractor phocaeensis]